MKKILIVFTIFLLLSTLILTINEQALPQVKLNNNKIFNDIYKITNKPENIIASNDFIFNPEDIELKDDAFHGSNIFNFVEWWYFDAIFDNVYSAQITIYVFDFFYQKFLVSGLNIYKEGINVYSRENYHIFSELEISSNIPFIEIDGKQFIKGYIDELSGKWIYDVTIDFPDAFIDLQFIGKSKGWKGNLSIGGWAVILPKAEVSGKINFYGIEYDVIGQGYHDHNWGMNLFNTLNFGWYWGRLNLDNLTIVWFIVMDTRYESEDICIISKDGGDYLNINSEDIYFVGKDYSLDTIWWIPNSFILKVDTNTIYFAIGMNAISIDSNFKLRGHYWRYHLNCYGHVIFNKETKDVSGIQIAELNRFR